VISPWLNALNGLLAADPPCTSLEFTELSRSLAAFRGGKERRERKWGKRGKGKVEEREERTPPSFGKILTP